MNPRRNGIAVALATVILAVAGCGAQTATNSGGPLESSGNPAGSGSSAGPGSPDGGGGPGGGPASAAGVPVPLRSLTCAASPAAVPAALPSREWTAVAWCPVTVGRSQLEHPDPASPPTVTRGDLGPLVAALRQSDAPRSTGPCPLYRVLLPTFWLVDGAGSAYQPRIPQGPCGQPAQAVTTAMAALGLH
jgi:hypothetical protein